MAAIDYGALVIKNGVPVNKNSDLFMTAPEYFEEYARCDYHAWCGDKEFAVCFYKCCVAIVKDGHLVKTFWNHPFKSETHYIDDIHLTIRRLDDLIPEYPTHLMDCDTWQDYVRECWQGATGNEKDSELDNGRKYHRLWKKRCKEIGRKKPIWYNSTLKYSATWEYKGDKWEVIFGYGIDPNEDTFDLITSEGKYNYGEQSEKYIREKFFGEVLCLNIT